MYEPTCVHPCILMHMHVCRCRDGSRKSTLGIFLSHHPPSFWRRGLWLNLELPFLARLVGHSEPQGSFSLHSLPSVMACLHQYRKLNSGSCVPAENTSSTSYLPNPKYCLLGEDVLHTILLPSNAYIKFPTNRTSECSYTGGHDLSRCN